jgi:hypothetical protein
MPQNHICFKILDSYRIIFLSIQLPYQIPLDYSCKGGFKYLLVFHRVMLSRNKLRIAFKRYHIYK